MTIIKHVIILFFLIIHTAWGQDIQGIKKGQASPIDGFVISTDFEKELRQINEDSKILKRQNILLKDLQVTQEYMVTLHSERASNAQKELEKEQIKGFFKSTLYFIGGAFACNRYYNPVIIRSDLHIFPGRPPHF